MSRQVELVAGLAAGAVVGAIYYAMGRNSAVTSVLAGVAFTAMWLLTGAILRRRGKD